MSHVVARWLVSAFLLCCACLGHAAQERYDYDGVGRLVRVIDEQGRATEYVYDAAGNLLQVTSGTGAAQGPSVSVISPLSLRRGETKVFQISGSGLTGVHLSVADPGLEVTNLRTSSTQVLFDLTATMSASLGSQPLTLSNAAGTVSTTIAVGPLQPKLGMSPIPIAVAPTGVLRSFFVSISSPDNIAHVVNVASANTAIATVTPSNITLAAGQTEAVVSVAGLSGGTTAINLTSATLPSTSIPAFVTSEFTGLTTSLAAPVGVTLQTVPGSTPATFGPIVSPLIGVVVGGYIAAITPSTLSIGTQGTLVISGAGLQGVTAVGIQPADGLMLGAISVAPDGLTVTVPVSVTADAPRTVRKVVLAGAQQPYLPARPDANQLFIALPMPEVFSVDPLVLTTGTTGATLTVRGRNLQTAQVVSIAPSNGISVGTPLVNAEGTSLRVGVSIAPLAPTGDRVLSVITSGGVSSAAASPSNTLRVVSEILGTVTPVASPLVGVILGDAGPPASIPLGAYATLVGVTLGTGISARTPGGGIIGQIVELTLSGSELRGVTAIELAPATGVTVGAPTVSADGKTVTVSVSIAADAPQTLRALRVRAGSLQVPFSDPAAAQFSVSAPLPVIESSAPFVYVIGATPVITTLSGRNLQTAQLVRVVPPDGVSIAPPAVNAAGTELTTSISVTALATAGTRVLVVTTAAGESSLLPAPANTIQLVTATSGTVTPVVAANVGLLLESISPAQTQLVGPIAAPALGIVLQDSNSPTSVQETARAMVLGVAVGAYATAVQAPPLGPNTSATLTILGSALNDVTALTVTPPSNVAIGALQIAADGSQIMAPITVQSAAIAGLRKVQVLRGADKVPFIPAGNDSFGIGVGAPNIDSITPILGNRGQTITMIIRGQNFQHLSAITAIPAAGLFIDAAPVVNALGTEITLRIGIAPDAPLDGRVIGVITAGGATTSNAIPANTFTVQH